MTFQTFGTNFSRDKGNEFVSQGSFFYRHLALDNVRENSFFKKLNERFLNIKMRMRSCARCFKDYLTFCWQEVVDRPLYQIQKDWCLARCCSENREKDWCLARCCSENRYKDWCLARCCSENRKKDWCLARCCSENREKGMKTAQLFKGTVS